MKRNVLAGTGAVLMALGVAARLHNAWASPVLAGYDAFGHFTYVWFVAATGRVPMPTHGWSFFHPPLYYALMAGLWKALAAFDPVVRLKAAKVLLAAAGCVHALVAWRVVGRCFPGNHRVRLMATALVLLVPVQLYSAGFLGNEGVHAICGSLSLAALLAVLDRPTIARAAALGLCLGLALLAKSSAVVLVAASLASIAWAALVRRRIAAGATSAVVASVVLLAISGPYYARNLEAYGKFIQLSRETFMVSYVENNQPQAARGWADYLTFDPLIFRRPVWPRGSTPVEDGQPHDFDRAVRESVWTGLYANTWFDGFGGWVLPAVVDSDASRHAGQLLLTLGLLPTGLMLVGAWSAVCGLRRRGWDDTVVAFALSNAAMLALFVYGTRQAPIAAAVKATYFTPISVVFAFWFAHGLVVVDSWRPRWTTAVDAICAVLGVISLVVFWQGLLFDSETIGHAIPRYDDGRKNQLGVVEYAGGRVADARRAFEQAAANDYALAWENLAFLAIDDGRPGEGLRDLRRAARLQKEQIDGGPVAGQHFLKLAEADDHHSMAVVLHGLGRRDRAIALWQRAIHEDPTHAEALWCLALARLEDGLATATGDGERRDAYDDAERALANVRLLDPGLKEGWTLAAIIQDARGDCDGEALTLAAWKALPWWVERRYPVETGTGAGFSASIGRRRLTQPRRAELVAPRRCAAVR